VLPGGLVGMWLANCGPRDVNRVLWAAATSTHYHDHDYWPAPPPPPHHACIYRRCTCMMSHVLLSLWYVNDAIKRLLLLLLFLKTSDRMMCTIPI